MWKYGAFLCPPICDAGYFLLRFVALLLYRHL